MISVIIPTRNAEHELAPTLAALVPAAVEGLVREVIIADGGSRDRTLEIADGSGAEIVIAPPGRGQQLKAAAGRARFPWLLFLHADTRLEHGWENEVEGFISAVMSGRRKDCAAAFRLALDDHGFAPRAIETAVWLRTTLLKLPYGDQGLVISRRLYDHIGGFREMPLLEDVDLARRLGRRITMLNARATTSARRYKEEGYARRVLRNQACLALYHAGVSPARIARFYERERHGPERIEGQQLGREA